MAKYFIHFKSGGEKEISRSIYNRFANKTRRNESMDLGDGAIMSLVSNTSWDWIERVGEPEDEYNENFTGAGPTTDPNVMTQVKPLEKPDILEPKPEDKDPEPEKKEEPGLDVITIQEIKQLMNDHKLDQKGFAKEIGYSPQAVRMAIKENRITQPFSNKIRETFHIFPEKTE